MQLKKFFAVLPALALSTALVAAQEPQPAPTNQSTQTNVGQPTDTNEPVYKGCVSGTKDNYILTTSDGKAFRLHSDKDIAEHVGKMVEIRGTVKKEGADRPADAQPASATSELDVADLKNVEGSCPTTGAANDMPQSDATNQAATTEPAKTEEQKATVTETPAASAAVSAETPAASASAETTTQPSASAEVKTEPAASEPAANAAVSTQDQASVPANNATDQTATASAGNEQKADADAAQLPETASPLPLLGLLGFASTGLGLLMRRK